MKHSCIKTIYLYTESDLNKDTRRTKQACILNSILKTFLNGDRYTRMLNLWLVLKRLLLMCAVLDQNHKNNGLGVIFQTYLTH